MIILVLIASMLLPSFALGATYYIAPTGNNANNGTTSATPFLTFAYAINAARAWCGDTLILLDGTYGDGTSTGRVSISGVACTAGDELLIQAQNQRKAKIQATTGSGKTISISSSSYITLNGLYAVNSDNAAVTTTDVNPLYIASSNHITVTGGVFSNPNRYTNSHVMGVYYSQDVLLEDNEGYVFNRHCVIGWQSQRVVARRIYCNPRGGMPSGGVGAGVGLADAVFSMYPCKDCIQENTIADSVTNAMYLTEINATYGGGILMSGSKVLGSICIKCRSNGIYANARSAADLNHSPQNITIENIVMQDFNSGSTGIRTSDGVNVNIAHYTFTRFGGASTQKGFSADDTTVGATPAQASVTIVDSTIQGSIGTGFFVSGHNTWSGNNLNSYNNAAAFSPLTPSNWGTVTTTNPQLGSCIAWIPNTSPLKGAGTGGSDIGATILYRYVDGVLTSIPLWDPVTGAFPHGVADADGLNRVAGQSLYDVHIRLNINTGGCAFPPGYGSSGPTNPGSVVATSDLDGAHIHPVPVGIDSLTAFVMTVYDGPGSPDFAIGVSSSCGGGEALLGLGDETVTTSAGGNRSIATFGRINPSSGSCTLTPTFSGPKVTGWVMQSISHDNVGSYRTVSGATSASASPSVTATSNTGDIILSGLATSNVPTISAGTSQVLLNDKLHGSQIVRGAVSEQLSSGGTIASYSMSGIFYWAIQAVALVPTIPGGGSSSTFRVTKYRIGGLYGVEGSPEVTIGHLAAENTPGKIAWGGYGRIRVEILVENGDSVPTGVALYCSTNGGTYMKVQNTFGAGDVRLFGGGFSPILPSDLSPTTQRFSGTFRSGYTKRDASTTLNLPAITQNTRTELDYQIGINPMADAGDTVTCEVRRDDGSILGVHTVTPTISVVDPSASMGF